MCRVDLCCRARLSLAAESRGYSSGRAQASTVVAASGSWALELGPVVLAHGLSCPKGYEIFLDQGSTHVPQISRQILTC